MRGLRKAKDLFVKHPSQVGETYFEHFIFASKTAKDTAKISCIMILHAVFPFVCEHTASDKLKELNELMQNRREGCK